MKSRFLLLALVTFVGLGCRVQAAAAARPNIIIIMVPDTPDVENALFGEHGVAAGLTAGKTVVDMSSISPIATKAFAKKINPKVIVVKKGDILNLIHSCEFLITIDLSTTLLEAQILKKPTVSILIKNYNFGTPEIFKAKSCLITNLDTVEPIVTRLSHDNSFKQDIVSNADKFVSNYVSNQGNSSEKFLKMLNEL